MLFERWQKINDPPRGRVSRMRENCAENIRVIRFSLLSSHHSTHPFYTTAARRRQNGRAIIRRRQHAACTSTIIYCQRQSPNKKCSSVHSVLVIVLAVPFDAVHLCTRALVCIVQDMSAQLNGCRVADLPARYVVVVLADLCRSVCVCVCVCGVPSLSSACK